MVRMRLVVPAIAAGAVIAAVSAGAPALAASPKSYTHWSAAQRAAGFQLVRPTTTVGLKPASPIEVTGCPGKNPGHRRIVLSVYLRESSLLELTQTDSATLCGEKKLPGRFLGTWWVNGTRAQLYGICGGKGQPGCTSRHATRFLTWARNGVRYLTFSANEWRASLLTFARGTRLVK